MAHPCIYCGSECYCNGDIDDVIVSITPKKCEGCGCEGFAEDQGWIDEDDGEQEFNPCLKCDGHPACEDYGCAIELGLAKMVKKNIAPGNDEWG